MRYWRLILITVLVCVVQLGFLPAMRPFGVVPNLLMVLVVVVGLTGTATAALGLALVGGLLLDLTSGSDFGLRTGLFMLVALVAGLVHRAGFSVRGVLAAGVIVTAASLVGTLAIMAGLVGTTTQWAPGVVLGRFVLELGLNLGFVPLLQPVVRWASESDMALMVAE